MKNNQSPTNGLPKIGIRPVIDGLRRSVRDSLEETSMRLAKSTAQLLGNHLRHSNGQSVECIVASIS
jgi:L-fucose isomerase